MSYQRDFPRKLKVGVVGIGSHSYRNILPALNYLPVELAAVCNRGNEAAGKATSAQYGCAYYKSPGEMYRKEKLDAVFLSVSPQAHPELVIEAFSAGVHVWLEKPVAMRAGEVEKMIQAKGKLVSVVGFKKLFMPAAEKALEIISSEKYGKLQSLLAVYPMSMPENGEKVLAERTFTNWLGNGCHPLSLMLAAGGKAESVTVQRGKLGGGVCLIAFVNGVSGTFHMASGPQPIERYQFFGEKWHLSIENSSRVVLQRGIPFDYGKNVNFAPPGDESGAVVWEPQNCLATLENKALFVQGIYAEMRYFCDCVLEGRQAEKGSLDFALEVMKVYEAALLSNGRMVRIE